MEPTERNSNEGIDSKRIRLGSPFQEDPVECITLSDESDNSKSASESELSDSHDAANEDSPELVPIPSNSHDHDTTGLPANSEPGEELNFLQLYKMQSMAPSPGELFGPKHKIQDDSFILYKADSLTEFSKYSNQDGFVPVVVDPEVGEYLRDEQKDGIGFMFHNYNERKGCLLAHEMGVGKTLSCITLVHTLLQQSVNSSRHYRPSLSKVVIVTPKTLVSVWEEEFRKWLRSEGPNVVRTICKQKEDEEIIKAFLGRDNKNSVLIISYETIKKHQWLFQVGAGDEEEAWRLAAPLDLIIFDEVHRLKNHKSQISKSCYRLQFKVKIGLTGTPVQNTLEELCRLVDIVQPNALLEGTGCNEAEFDEQFTKRFSAGNLTKRCYVLTPEDTVKLTKLKYIIGPILHIRQNKVDVPKYEVLLCGRLEEFQKKMYTEITNILNCSDNKGAGSKFWYTNVTLLRNVCHHPALARKMLKTTTHKGVKSVFLKPVEELCKHEEHMGDPWFEPYLAQKMKFICALVVELQEKYKTDRSLSKAKIQDKERVVIVSYSTQVLDKVEKFLMSGLGIKCLSINGNTTEKNRTKNIERFNNLNEDNPVFLLSSKAGGVGITLTGGNHLVLLDPDWNPANDEQAMARIWRKGQKKPCYIYRLFATGTIEEVVFKRQLSKKELDRYITDNDFMKFDILREGAGELFKYDPNTLSSIHDSINCTKEECRRPISQVDLSASTQPGPSTSTFPGFSGYALDVDEESEDAFEGFENDSDISSLAKWSHFIRADQLPQGDDELPILRKLWSYNGRTSVGITFAFYRKTDTKDMIPIEDANVLIDFLVGPGSVSARQIEH